MLMTTLQRLVANTLNHRWGQYTLIITIIKVVFPRQCHTIAIVAATCDVAASCSALPL